MVSDILFAANATAKTNSDFIFAIVGVIAAIVSILAILLGIAYNMGVLAKEIKTNTEVTTKVFENQTKQDNRIQKVEDTKADKKDVEKLEKELVKLQTEHNICQGKKEVKK